MAGRRPLPTRLKLMRGNPGKRALNHHEPEPTPIERPPAPPRYLNDLARKFWRDACRELIAMRTFGRGDLPTVAAYASACAEMAEADELIKQSGLTASSPKGGEYIQPLVVIRSMAQKRVKAFAAELGLTPSARSRIKATPPSTKGESNDPLDRVRIVPAARRA